MESERLGKDAHKYEHNDGKSIKYHEKMIAASYVGSGFAPILKTKRIEAGTGELTAAKELVRQLNRDHHQYCDVIVVDSLYINAPFINTCLRNNKDIVVRVKQDNDLRKDAEGLTKNKKPDHVYKNITPKDEPKKTGTLYDLKIWDEENSVFHWLKTHWNFDHVYSSDPHVIQAMYFI